MKLHLPLGLLVAVLAAFQTNAADSDQKEFKLEYTVRNADWAEVPGLGDEGDEDDDNAPQTKHVYHFDLPFAIYREKDWELNVKFYKTDYQLSTRPLNEEVAYNAEDFLLSLAAEGSISMYGLGMLMALEHNPDVNAASRFELNVESVGGGVSGVLSAFVSAAQHTTHSPDTDGPYSTHNFFAGMPWNDPPQILFAELYTSDNFTSADVAITANVDMEVSGEYVVAREGTLGAYDRGGTGLLTVWDDPRYPVDVLVLNGDEGRRVGRLFQNPDYKENVLRFAPQGSRTRQAVGEGAADFQEIRVKEGGVVYSDDGFYARGIRVDEGATGYTLDVGGEVGFADDAKFTFAEDFTLTGNGTVTWDGTSTFDIAEGKTVHWNIGGSRDSETGDITAGRGHVTLGTKDEIDTYMPGGTLSVGGDYALGTGDIDVYGSTLDMNGTVWANKVNLYAARDAGSNLVGARGAAEGTEVRITAFSVWTGSEEEGEGGNGAGSGETTEVAPVKFGVGGLKGDYLKAVDISSRGGQIYDIGGGTVTVGQYEGFNFLVRQENFTYATGVNEPTANADTEYMLEFSESGAVEFKGGKVVLTLDDSVAEALVKICEDHDGGYVDIWFTNGILTELKEIQENGVVGDLKYWFQKCFDLEVGFTPGDYLYYNEEQKDDLTIEVPEENDFVGGAEGGRGVLRFYLRVGGVQIWMASTHGDANAQDISNEQWKEVRVNTDMKVVYSKRDDGNIVLRNLSSGSDGRGNLTIFNKLGDEDVTLNIDQQADVTAVSRELRGSLIMDQGEAANRINLTKKGGAEFSVTGNVENVGTLRVEKGLFTIGGDLVNAGTLSVNETEVPAEGEEVTQNKLVINGWKSTAETLETVGLGSVLEVNGVLTLARSATPTGQGTIGGKGAIVVNGTLNASDVVLAGVGVELRGENAGLVTSSQATVESATGEVGTNKVGALSVAEGTEASLRLGGDLIIDSTDTHFRGAATYYHGSIESADGSAKTITVSGASTDQTLHSVGSGAVDLTVDGKAHLSLIGETRVDPDTQKAMPTSVVTYGNTTVKEGSALTLIAPDVGQNGSVVAQLQTGNFTVEKDGVLGVYYNLKPTGGNMAGVEPAVVSSGTTAWGEGAKVVLGSLGINPFDLGDPQDLKDLKVLSAAQGITGLSNGQKLDYVLDGSFLVFWKDVNVMYKDGNIVVNATARHGNIFAQGAEKSENVQAGARLLWDARTSNAMNDSTTELSRLMNQIVYALGNSKEASGIFAGVAGSTVPAVGTAQRDALRAQMLRMRDHAGAMGLDNESTYESLPYSRFWMEASGDFANLNDDSMMSGYKYNAWGGTVGLEMDLSERTSLGLGLSALYGDLDGGTCDKLDGDMDSYYLSLMARFTRQRWGHTVLGVVGLNSADIDRTVQYGAGSYTTSGSTDGWGAGLMYELTYDIPLDEERTQVLQPLLGASVMRTTLDGYNEGGVGAQGVGLNVGEQEWVTSTFTLGLRWISSIGASVFNTAAQLELRANIAQDVGDSQGSADVALQANPGVRQSVKAAEVGKTAAQLGAALRMPISEEAQIYFNVGADLRSGMDAWNATAGLKYSF